MHSSKLVLRAAGLALMLLAVIPVNARAQDESGFPFDTEMMLDAPPQPGSRRIPDLDIGANGDVTLELWCKGGKGRFSVAGNTVIFVPGAMEERACPPARAQADDDLLAALSEATNWKRQGDVVSFIGPRTLQFRINTN